MMIERIGNPCSGYCPDRDCECHAKCRKYAAFRAYIDECNRIKYAKKEHDRQAAKRKGSG